MKKSVLFFVLAATLGTSSCSVPWRFERIDTSSSGEATLSSLPAGSFVVDVTKPLEVVLPFALREDVTAASGYALVLAEGAGTPGRIGRAAFEFVPPAPGTYHLWAHVNWRDSCGNSISVRVNNSPQYLVGQDAVYNVWHWVKAGRYDLADAASHRLEVLEREDGVAIDQFLFTPDDQYVPSAPVLKSGEAAGIRRFADDFGRSPGHGMEAWELLSGRWEIAFSLDPNRIPNQYSLVGDCGEESEPAVALVKGPPWVGCRFEFSAMPRPGAVLGAVLDREAATGSEIRVELFAGDRDGTAHI
ncbi:MAG: hypothetical protein N2255_05960, partial [Kiritimatiellae bacterium]|nr:hypothetical protein [Kiritimatiellia bacterium]